MDILFKYNGKVISTPNLEKKLKRMKLQLSDIEIIDTPIKKTIEDNELDDDKEQLIIRSTEDDIRRVVRVPKGTRPPISQLLKKHKWNSKSKTGIKGFTDEFFQTMYYEY